MVSFTSFVPELFCLILEKLTYLANSSYDLRHRFIGQYSLTLLICLFYFWITKMNEFVFLYTVKTVIAIRFFKVASSFALFAFD